MKNPRRAAMIALTLIGSVAPGRSFASPLVGDASGSTAAAVTGNGTSSATGVRGKSDNGYGVSGSSNVVGVIGISNSTGSTGAGVIGSCASCDGVAGSAVSGNGVDAQSQSGNGVYASGGFNGVLGVTTSTNPLAGGVHGVTNGSGNAMRAESNGDGNGLVSTANAGYAIYATSATTDAIVGVAGNSLHAAGVWGKSNGASTYGIYSSGDLYVTALGASPGNAYKPGGGSWLATSDARVKKDVAAFTPSLSDIEKIHPVRFKYNGLGGTADSGKEYVGVIAQDLEKVLPFMVSAHKGKLRDGDKEATEIKEVDPSAFTYVLINAVKQLSQQNAQKDAQYQALAAQVNALLEQNRRLAEVAKLTCADHPSDKACAHESHFAQLGRAKESVKP